MSEIPGTIPSAEEHSRAERDRESRGYDPNNDPGEKWRAGHKFTTAIWPFVGGLLLGIFAPRLYEMAGDWNQWALWLIFPYVQLAGRPEWGLSPEITRTLPQMILFVQFPVEGLLATLNLRLKGRATYAFALIFLHLVGAFVLFLLALPRS